MRAGAGPAKRTDGEVLALRCPTVVRVWGWPRAGQEKGGVMAGPGLATPREGLRLALVTTTQGVGAGH